MLTLRNPSIDRWVHYATEEREDADWALCVRLVCPVARCSQLASSENTSITLLSGRPWLSTWPHDGMCCLEALYFFAPVQNFWMKLEAS